MLRPFLSAPTIINRKQINVASETRYEHLITHRDNIKPDSGHPCPDRATRLPLARARADTLVRGIVAYVV